MNFQDLIPNNLTVVMNSDHPFVFDGPDFLVTDKSGLLALFTIRPKEEKNQQKLLIRLTNSLVAYPAATKMILLITGNHGDHIDLSLYENNYFDKLIEKNDLKRSKTLIKDLKQGQRIRGIKKIQKNIFTFQSQVEINNLEYIERSEFRIKQINTNELKGRTKYYDRYSNKEVTARANIYTYNEFIIGVKKLSSNNLIELKPFYEFVISSEFSLDQGIPYIQHLTKKILNLDHIPGNRYDPFKPIRIASLFGWHIANSSNVNELTRRISKNKRKL